MRGPANGLLVISTERWTVAVIVEIGVVADGPPLARARGLIGRDARDVWRQYKQLGAELSWTDAEVIP